MTDAQWGRLMLLVLVAFVFTATLGPMAHAAPMRMQRVPGFKAIPKDAYEIDKASQDGLAEVIRLRRDIRVAGIPCKAGTPIRISRDDFQKREYLLNPVLAEDFRQKGVIYQAGTELWVGFGSNVSRGVLAGDQVVQGMPLKGGTQIAFYEGGKLREGTLGRDQTIATVGCKAGGIVRVSRAAQPLRCTLSADQPIGGVPAKGDTIMRVLRLDKLAKLTLARNHTFQGTEFAAGHAVYFLNSDEVLQPDWARMKFLGGHLAKTETIQGIACQGGQRATFEGTALTSCVLSAPMPVASGINPKAGTRVWRNAEGRIRKIDLAETQVFNNKEYPAKYDVEIDANGQPGRVTPHVALPR